MEGGEGIGEKRGGSQGKATGHQGYCIVYVGSEDYTLPNKRQRHFLLTIHQHLWSEVS